MAEKLDMGGTPPIPFSHITNSTEASRGAESSASELEQPAEMPPGGSRRPRTPRREVDLSSVLTAGEKNELSLLVSKITDRMQQQITRVFDATGVGDPQKNSPPSFWSKLPANLRDLSLSHREKENVNLVNTEPKEGPADADAAAPGTKKEKEALGLEELKKETLQYFRRWQTAVQRRVADISVKNTSASSRGQTFAAVSKKGNGSREASKPLGMVPQRRHFANRQTLGY
ncbi:hypothetical protein VTK73DRAFT_3308 [Phialemonium thermophilum]|uniref:Uncharacterized protein n=1 Tax=Phialemonium thermophilum TaxID=223376 RepID=A0ABR3Y162_9PEZI